MPTLSFNPISFPQGKISVSHPFYTPHQIIIFKRRQSQCTMTETQQEDLFIEWGLYEDLTRKAMVNEYESGMQENGEL